MPGPELQPCPVFEAITHSWCEAWQQLLHPTPLRWTGPSGEQCMVASCNQAFTVLVCQLRPGPALHSLGCCDLPHAP